MHIIWVVITGLAFSNCRRQAHSERDDRNEEDVKFGSHSLVGLEQLQSRWPPRASSALRSFGTLLLASNATSAFRPQHGHVLRVPESVVSPVQSSAAVLMAAESEKVTPRPTVGDTVRVKNTSNVRTYCPQLINTVSEIIADSEDPEDYQPYLVEAAGCWLSQFEVELEEKQNVKKLPYSEAITRLKNEEEFHAKGQEAVSQDKVVVIALFASWCRACAAVKPKFQRLVNDWPDVEFCDILLDDNKKLAKANGIKNLPYIWIHAGKKGQVQDFQMGPGKISQLKEHLVYYTKERELELSAAS